MVNHTWNIYEAFNFCSTSYSPFDPACYYKYCSKRQRNAQLIEKWELYENTVKSLDNTASICYTECVQKGWCTMLNAIGSGKDLTELDYYDLVSDILENDVVQELKTTVTMFQQIGFSIV